MILSISVEINAGVRMGSRRLDEETTAARIAAMEAYDEALRLFGDDGLTSSWRNELGKVVDDDQVTSSIAGLSLRRLHDVRAWEPERVAAEFARHTGSRQPKESGAFLEGFLRGGSEVLLQDEPLLQLLDTWLCELSETDFTDSLPLLRRSMSSFDAVARRRVLEKVQRGRQKSTLAAPELTNESNPAFEAALPLLCKILGLGRARMISQKERWRRWQLALGVDDGQNELSDRDRRLNAALSALYDSGTEKRRGGLGASSPRVAKWLGDIREFFPTPVVQIVQKDAFERLNLKALMLEPEFLSTLEADVHLVADLIALRAAIPGKTLETARQVVRKVVDDLLRRLEHNTRETLRGALNRSQRTRRPRHADIDWPRTIRANSASLPTATSHGCSRDASGTHTPHEIPSANGPCHLVRRSVWIDGYLGRVLIDFCSCHGIDPWTFHETHLLRYIDRGPYGSTRGPGRGALWRPTRGWDGYQLGTRVLRKAGGESDEGAPRAHNRLVRRR